MRKPPSSYSAGSLLEAYLNNSEALDILKKAGYEDFSFGKILLRFKKHYEAYLNDEHKQFPHEMGLSLLDIR